MRERAVLGRQPSSQKHVLSLSLTPWVSGSPFRRRTPTLCWAFSNGPGRDRTCDLGIKSPLLYQLSYRPHHRVYAGVSELETIDARVVGSEPVAEAAARDVDGTEDLVARLNRRRRGLLNVLEEHLPARDLLRQPADVDAANRAASTH